MEEIALTFLEEANPEAPITSKTKLRIRQSLKALSTQTDVWHAPIDELRAKSIYKAIENIKTLSNASKNYVLYAVRKVFDFAEVKEIIRENHLGNLKGFSVRPRKLELPNDRQFRELVQMLQYPELRPSKHPPLPSTWQSKTRTELSESMGVSKSTLCRIIAEANGTPPKRKGRPEVAFTFLFLCFTGLRMGEARALRWKDVEEDRIIIRGTKTDSAHRSLPIYHQLAALLEKMKEFRNKSNEEDRILIRQRIDKAIARACGKLNLPYLRHHDLRHYFATKAIQAGVDLTTVAKWLGHSDGGVLAMKVYANVIDEHSQRQAAKLVFPK
ncbi:MAG: site-specific integrase [Verrucomicrobia bacterium]|nr:site-specific integrase [Verrucomicrobiota bacterium]MDA0724346.1 site-specific integrase [Verrucomicrobiota bacterium]MDA1048801.1 site-specific integrase [Verrucomicrobiota bacterium]